MTTKTLRAEITRQTRRLDTIDRVPAAGDKGTALKKQLQEVLIEDKRYIEMVGQDPPTLRNWKWLS